MQDVEVHITDRAIISALNTPGGAIFEWRDDVAHETIHLATIASPINSVLNAQHRMGIVGTYRASWGFDRVGSNGHRVQATIYNSADHAEFVEYGRGPSLGWEEFSWRGFVPPGSIHAVKGTAGYRGRHILAKAAAAAVARFTGGASFALMVSE